MEKEEEEKRIIQPGERSTKFTGAKQLLIEPQPAAQQNSQGSEEDEPEEIEDFYEDITDKRPVVIEVNDEAAYQRDL